MKHLRVWLGVGVSLVLLWAAFRGVDRGQLVHSLGQVRTAWLIPVLITIPVRFWLTAVRWQLLLRPVKAIGVHRLFGVTLIGFMANNVLPARMGEFVRAYALGKSESLPASLSFATIVVERLFDGFTLLAFLVIGVLCLRPEPWLVWSALGSFALYVGVLLALLWLRHGPARSAVLARLPRAARARIAELVDSFALGLDVLGDRRALWTVTGLSLAIWLINVAGLWGMFVAYSLDLPWHASFLVLAIVAVALVLPSAPGYVGTFQVGTVAGMALYSVPEATALSLSLLYHALSYVPITAGGLAYLGAMNLTLGELKTAGEKAA